MPFDKNSAKQAGKKSSRKNVPNRATKRAKEFINDLLAEDQERAMKDWNKLTPWERWQIRVRLQEFIIPKLQRSDFQVNAEHLTKEQLQFILDEALEKFDSNGQSTISQ